MNDQREDEKRQRPEPSVKPTKPDSETDEENTADEPIDIEFPPEPGDPNGQPI